MSIRITQERFEGEPVIAVHGVLLREGVPEFKAVCERIEGKLLLDLANLTTADDEGLKVILDLEASGAEIVAASQYIRLLLDREKSS